jgi:hypothetical protein
LISVTGSPLTVEGRVSVSKVAMMWMGGRTGTDRESAATHREDSQVRRMDAVQKDIAL